MNRFAILGALGVAVIVAALLLNYVINRDELGDTGTPAPVVSTAPSGSPSTAPSGATTAPSGGSSGETQGTPAQGSTTQGSTTQGSAGAGSTAQGSAAQGSAPSQASTDQSSTAQSSASQGTANQGTASAGGTATQNAPAQNSTTAGTTTAGTTGQGTTGQATGDQGQAAAGSTTAPASGGQASAPAPSGAATASSGGAGTVAGQSSTGDSTGSAAPSTSNAPAATTQTANAAPAGGTAAPAEPPPVRPSFDIVRVTPDGGTVIAGRAAPHATVTITADGQKIGAVVADDRGEWVILPTSKLVPGNHQIAIASQLGTAPPVASDDVVIVVVPQPPVAGQTKATGEGTQTAQATPPQQPLAVVVPRTDQGSSTVLQSPNPPQSGQLVLQSVDYDAEGRVVIGGRAGPGKEVRAYLDNQLVGKVKADQSGVWHITPDHHVMPGLHTLRIDEVDENGKVMARVESPFSRAEPLSIDAGDQVVVVQPGNNLWLIATHTYGSGLRYTVIYQANKSQIKNPDLIYPGQVFKLPMDAP